MDEAAKALQTLLARIGALAPLAMAVARVRAALARGVDSLLKRNVRQTTIFVSLSLTHSTLATKVNESVVVALQELVTAIVNITDTSLVSGARLILARQLIVDHRSTK